MKAKISILDKGLEFYKSKFLLSVLIFYRESLPFLLVTLATVIFEGVPTAELNSCKTATIETKRVKLCDIILSNDEEKDERRASNFRIWRIIG